MAGAAEQSERGGLKSGVEKKSGGQIFKSRPFNEQGNGFLGSHILFSILYKQLKIPSASLDKADHVKYFKK